MFPNTIEIARRNHLFGAETVLARISAGRGQPSDYRALAYCYRIMGICSLLEKADRNGFRENLCKSAFVSLDYLISFSAGKIIGGEALAMTSVSFGFAEALAAGNLELAGELVSRFGSPCLSRFEYEEDYLFFRYLGRLFSHPDEAAELGRISERWGALEGLVGSTNLRLCDALSAREQGDFTDAFSDYLQERAEVWTQWEGSPGFSEEISGTEGKLDILALAILRIAELRGIGTEKEYAFAPALARLPVSDSFPPYDSWREPRG